MNRSAALRDCGESGTESPEASDSTLPTPDSRHVGPRTQRVSRFRKTALPMKPSPTSSFTPSLRGLTTAFLLAARLAAAEGDRLELVSEDGMKLLGGYVPQRMTLTKERPAALTRPPADLKADATSYGLLAFGPAEAPRKFLVAIEETAGAAARCWVDGNANGDLTDDPAVEWKNRDYQSQDGRARAMYSGGARVTVSQAGESLPVRISLYRFDPADPDRAALKSVLLYYGDYVRRGTVDLGGRPVPALLCDDRTLGDFRGDAGSTNGSGVRLTLDLNGDGTYDRRGWESFDVRKPFNIGGTTWEVAGLGWSGASLRVVKSEQTVAEIKAPPSTAVGQPFPTFTARTLSGREVEFPEAYKGRLVILDFWATWCGPCRAELPNLRSAYADFHAKGIEVLGVSLDQDNSKAKVEAFLKVNDVTWDQVYEGGGWKTRLAQMFGIDSIPRVFLVDGDTGKILAGTDALRGPALAKTLTTELERRKK